MKKFLLHIIIIYLFFIYESGFALYCLAQTNWTSQPLPGGTTLLNNIDFLNYDNGFSGGWKWGQTFEVEATGVYTTNGGLLWQLSNLPDSTRVIVCSRIFNNSNGIAAGAYNYTTSSNVNLSDYISELYIKKDYTQIPYALIGYLREVQTGGTILKTTDAGATWNTIYALPDSFSYITGANFLDENIGFIIAPADSFTHILKTTDGGISWKIKFTFPPSSGSRSIIFSSPVNGVAAGYNTNNFPEQGFIAATNDGGENWSYQFVSEAGNLAAASFSDENTFYATGQNFQNSYVFKSTNAGLDWFQTSFQSNEFFLDGINFLEGTDAGFVFGTKFSGFQIFFIKTLDGGNSWSEPEYIFPTSGYNIFGSKILDENNVYLSGGNPFGQGLILKTSDAALPVELELLEQPVEFVMAQNYPNPFNPTTKISWQVPIGSWQTLKIYDVLGNEVATLVDEYKPIGSYEVEWDASGLPSGVYFYRLQAGEFVETKKMILLK